jgi:hypothetical protein
MSIQKIIGIIVAFGAQQSPLATSGTYIVPRWLKLLCRCSWLLGDV